MSSVEAAGSSEVAKFMLAAEASESLASVVPLGKEDVYSPAPFVGDAKGLSGRLCSKLHALNYKVHKLQQCSYNLENQHGNLMQILRTFQASY